MTRTSEPSLNIPSHQMLTPNGTQLCDINIGLQQQGLVQLQQQQQLRSPNETKHFSNSLTPIPQHESDINLTQQDSGIQMTAVTDGTSPLSLSQYNERMTAEIETAQLERQLSQVQTQLQ